MDHLPRLAHQLPLPYSSFDDPDDAPVANRIPARLVWLLQNPDGELACYLVPTANEAVDAAIFEDRTLLLAHRWTTERDALRFATAMKQDFVGEGWQQSVAEAPQ
jgi:hypothetical protein